MMFCTVVYDSIINHQSYNNIMHHHTSFIIFSSTSQSEAIFWVHKTRMRNTYGYCSSKFSLFTSYSVSKILHIFSDLLQIYQSESICYAFVMQVKAKFSFNGHVGRLFEKNNTFLAGHHHTLFYHFLLVVIAHSTR